MDDEAESGRSERREREARQAKVQAEVRRELKRWAIIALGVIVAAWLGWNLLWTHAYNECAERGEGFFAESGDINGAMRAANACRSDAYDNVFLFPKPG